MKSIRYILVIVLIGILSFLYTNKIYGQHKFSLDSNTIAAIKDTIDTYYKRHPYILKPRTNRLKIVPTFGVSYSNEMQFGAIAGFNGYYKNGIDTSSNLSQFSLFTQITTNLSVIGNIVGENYSMQDKFLINYNIEYARAPRYFWGIGYDNNIDNSNKSRFLQNSVSAHCELIYNRENIIQIGTTIGYDFLLAEDFSNEALIENYTKRNSSLDIGVVFNVNTKDSPVFPKRGIYIAIKQHLSSDINFAEKPFFKTNVIGDFYIPLWEQGVLAFDIAGEFNYGNTYWTNWSLFGGENRMRGYYQGRFRDKNMISTQMELRTMFGIHGPVAWIGAGNIFNSFQQFDIKNTLPTFGAGYRILLSGVIIRIDIGFGNKGNYGIYAGINQAF